MRILSYFPLRARAALLALCLAAAAYAQNAIKVETIVFEGNARLESIELLKSMPFKPGDELDLARKTDLLKSINEALAPLGYLALDMQHSGGEIRITLRESPELLNIHVSGAKAIKEKDIIKAVPFKEGEFLPIDAEFRARQAIEKLYEDEGYEETEVEVELEKLDYAGAEGKQNLRISVKETARQRIKDVKLIGNENISSMRIRMVMANKGSFLFFKNYFNSREFEEDLKNIELLYRSLGYLDVKVERGEFEKAKDGSWISPVIRIEEGPRYEIGSIRFSGYRIFGLGEIQEPFLELQGRIYDARELSQAMDALKRLYGDSGYIDASFATDEELDDENNIVNLKIDIEERNRVQIRNVFIERKEYEELDVDSTWFHRLMNKISPPLKESLIYKEADLEPGEPYRTMDELKAERRLRRLRIFKTVDVEPVITDDPEQRDVRIFVDDLLGRSVLNFGVAYNEESGGAIFLSYTEANLFGEARTLRLNFFLGVETQNINVTYSNPYYPMEGLLEGGLIRRALGRDEDDNFFDEARKRYSLSYYQIQRLEYDEDHVGGSIGYSGDIDEFRSSGVNFTLEHVNLTRDNPFIGSDFDNSYIVAKAGRTWTYDSTDDFFFPTEGVDRAFTVEAGAADGALLKASWAHSSYKQLGSRLVWSRTFKGGLLPYDADTIGLSERFFLGGDNDMRGYQFRGAGPKDPMDSDAATGGATKLLFQNELRYRFNDGVYALGFVDIGALGEGVLNPDAPRVSAGGGIRIQTRQPMPLLIGIDLAQSIIDESEDETRFVHFRLGPAF
ncbi:BamA/TamA family outer membrane protein [Candidatus Sumerlaeota bacterium]|nr:BamA/TamA family outer membrane protein [Candidatus Sumerlaeota bacterium]